MISLFIKNILYICIIDFNIKSKYKNNMGKYSEETVSIVNETIEVADVRGLVEHAMNYVSVYKDEVIGFVFDNIEDSEELYDEERKYLSEKIIQIVDELI